jgi:N-acetyl sugar amidotransferase
MNYCRRCVQPDTRPGIVFNSAGVCGACLYEDDVKYNIDWSQREKELRDIATWAKKKATGSYNCAIGISGGKDSTFQALYARDKLGLHVLLVNSEPEGITEIGRHNIENIINLGFDCIKVRPNPAIMKKLIKRDFYKFLNPLKCTEYSLWSSVYIIANQFNIPLVIQGENATFTLGVRTGLTPDGDCLNANKTNTLSEDWKTYISEDIEEKDLFLFHYNRAELDAKEIRGVWLQYYAKEWSSYNNVRLAIANGLMVRPVDHNPAWIGTYGNYYQMDEDILQVQQMCKYIKFGFGQGTDHACYDIRAGRITREEGVALVKAFDGLCAERYIREFCHYIGISIADFWETVNTFRGSMWKLNKGVWQLTSPIWEQDPPSSRINVYDLAYKLAV